VDKYKRYAATDKGKATITKKREKEQEKRDALKKIKRRFVEANRRIVVAKFSKQYTLHSITVANGQLSVKKRFNAIESETPQCVQGGVSRWSESILNPTYKKMLAKEKP
jgi:hypothetical protein